LKTLDYIPTNKIERAGTLVTTGIKVGGNYLKYYGKKALSQAPTKAQLDEENAKDIYDGLKSLKGSALKVAQMLSMERNILPQAYVEQFSLSQFSVPPLSAPLVRKLVRKYLGANPEVIFDTFATQSVNAASIGQVHQAAKNGKKLAVKIQYPGVADSIGSDLSLVKPIAMKMFNLKGKDTDKFFEEVEDKLLEETNYRLELTQGQEVAQNCGHLPHLQFPKYYPEWSSDKILTMDWMDGLHLSEYASQNSASSPQNNRLGQTLWDFYMYQMHQLRKVHADPHPGNFLVAPNGDLIAIDFGCMKAVPEAFYTPYFELSKPEILNNQEAFQNRLRALEILIPSDTEKETVYFTALFHRMMQLFTAPFHEDTFDFGNTTFWNQIAGLSQEFSKDTTLRKMNGNRGSKHFIYINRTFFGLYSLLNDLKAKVKIYNYTHFV
jgi:predicted unusual protein kinase regulating ubiquinone biosynthesis (AarF/ABC1/UbiB family)